MYVHIIFVVFHLMQRRVCMIPHKKIVPDYNNRVWIKQGYNKNTATSTTTAPATTTATNTRVHVPCKDPTKTPATCYLLQLLLSLEY